MLSIALAELGSGPWRVQELADAVAVPLASELAKTISFGLACELTVTLGKLWRVPALLVSFADLRRNPSVADIIAAPLAGAVSGIIAPALADALADALSRALANEPGITRTFAVEYVDAFASELTDALAGIAYLSLGGRAPGRAARPQRP